MIHSFGWADSVDRGALARLVSSISRFLDPQAVAAAAGADVQVLDCRRLGGAWVLDQLWARLGIGAAIRRVAQARRVDGELAERVIFALVAQRALEPASKLAVTGWVTERVFIEHLPTFSDDQAYGAMDFLLEALEEIAAEVFASVATLLNLQVDLVLVDTTRTYWHLDVPEELADALREDDPDDPDSPPAEAGTEHTCSSRPSSSRRSTWASSSGTSRCQYVRVDTGPPGSNPHEERRSWACGCGLGSRRRAQALAAQRAERGRCRIGPGTRPDRHEGGVGLGDGGRSSCPL